MGRPRGWVVSGLGSPRPEPRRCQTIFRTPVLVAGAVSVSGLSRQKPNGIPSYLALSPLPLPPVPCRSYERERVGGAIFLGRVARPLPPAVMSLSGYGRGSPGGPGTHTRCEPLCRPMVAGATPEGLSPTPAGTPGRLYGTSLGGRVTVAPGPEKRPPPCRPGGVAAINS